MHTSDHLRRALYGPVKHYLETLGFTVKGEVGGCDLVAIRETRLRWSSSVS
jgi:hypothetical protein